MNPHPRQRQAAGRAQPGERQADQQFWCVHPRQVDRCRGERQGPQHDQADQPEGTPCRQDEGGRGRAGDEEEDHRVVQALHPLPPGSRPGTAVIERAGPEQRAHADGVDGDCRDLRGPVRTQQQQRAGRQRRREPEQVQPAAKQRLGVVDTAPGVVERTRGRGNHCRQAVALLWAIVPSRTAGPAMKKLRILDCPRHFRGRSCQGPEQPIDRTLPWLTGIGGRQAGAVRGYR